MSKAEECPVCYSRSCAGVSQHTTTEVQRMRENDAVGNFTAKNLDKDQPDMPHAVKVTQTKMQALINSFPALKGRAGWRGDDSAHFRKCMTGMSSGEYCAAEFVLYVWNRVDNKFDMDRAINTWDQQNMDVFLDWLQNPWWM